MLWRNLDSGRGVVLRITRAGLEALGGEPDSPAVAAVGAREADAARQGATDAGRARRARTAARTIKTRGHTKQALLVGMLRRAESATIAEVVEATGWQPHTLRGALAGALKKRLGLSLVSEKVEGRGRVYRIAG